MDQKLTLKEMAKVYRKTPKTFSKYVHELGIPHEMLGPSMLFDPVAVSAHLAARKPDPAKVVEFKPAVRRSKAKKSRFAEAVGI